jgi:hypothetical protein
MSGSLNGHVALVTGGGRGTGCASDVHRPWSGSIFSVPEIPISVPAHNPTLLHAGVATVAKRAAGRTILDANPNMLTEFAAIAVDARCACAKQ